MDIGLLLCNAIIAAVVFRVIAVYTYVEVIVSCTAPFVASYVYTIVLQWCASLVAK